MAKRKLAAFLISIGAFNTFQNCSGTFASPEIAITDVNSDDPDEEFEGQAGGDDQDLAGSRLPRSFFAIHFEPRSATDETFEVLKKLINEADTYKIKLTLQFTPSWAKLILNDSEKTEMLRSWQANGHEVAAHHHGAHHGLDADGYSNLAQSSYQAAREDAYKKASSSARDIQNSAKTAGLAEIYKGSMEGFVSLLKKLAGQKELKLMTMPSATDLELDWMENFSYSIDNIKYSENGSTDSFEILDGALATPEYVEHRGFSVLEMEMQYLSDDSAVDKAREDHKSAGRTEIIGVVTHIEDYQGNSTYVLEWMKYLKSKDAKGFRNKTVSEILDKWE